MKALPSYAIDFGLPRPGGGYISEGVREYIRTDIKYILKYIKDIGPDLLSQDPLQTIA